MRQRSIVTLLLLAGVVVSLMAQQPVNVVDGLATLATADNQPVPGVAGTPSADVLTVQGAAGTTPVRSLLTDTGGTALVLAEDATHDAAFKTAGPQLFVACDETAPDAVDENDAIKVRGDCATGAPYLTPIAATAGGATVLCRSIDLDETEEDCKTSAGNFYSIWVTNLHASAWRYVKCYNATAANVTVGSTAPYFTLPVPPTATGSPTIGAVPGGFSTALSCAATTGVADNDTGAPGSNEVQLTVWGK